MHKYLFITYGEPGWRGVQMRLMRVAQYFEKGEVLFWNLYDSDFIKSWRLDVETKPASLVHPRDIKFPLGIEVVVFADIPTDELFEYCVYRAALLQNKKIVVCDQVYRRGQMSQGIFKHFADNSDLFLANSISAFKGEESNKVTLVPPQIELDLTPETKSEIYKKLEIPGDSVMIFGTGYHKNVYEKIVELTGKLANNNHKFYTVLTSPEVKKIKKIDQLILIPQATGDEYFKLLYAADIAFVKFGFLQILEAIALHKPTIVLGEAGQVLQNPESIDELLKEALYITQDLDNKVYSYVEKLVKDPAFREKKVSDLCKLHDGSLFGARFAADKIKSFNKLRTKTVARKSKVSKKIAILINNEISEKSDWLQNHFNILPICIIAPMPTTSEVIKRIPKELFGLSVLDFQFDQIDEILPHSYKNVHIFSRRKFDGFVDAFDWFENWIESMERYFEQADEIYISEQGQKFFSGLFLYKKSIGKIKKLP